MIFNKAIHIPKDITSVQGKGLETSPEKLGAAKSGRQRHFTKMASVLFALAAVPMAFGALERVGPVDNSGPGGGYPAWYQDKTGLTLEFCSPTNQAEVDGGWCVLLPPDVPNPPESFPNKFFDEHFYSLANASGTTTSGGKAKLVLALEGAFGGGPPAVGDQIVFARIRVVVTNIPDGKYTVYHPYGTDTYDVTGNKLFVTEDVGLSCPSGGFECALAGRFGPFLVPSNTPGGAELAAVAGPVPGKLYLADPARLGPVTGSPVNQNYFRIVGPNGDLLQAPGGMITDFTVNGRLFSGTIPGRVKVDRAVYDSGTGRVDVFASAFPTLGTRAPGSANPGQATPQLQYFLAPCAGASAPAGQAAGMRSSGHHAWGQSISQVNPGNVCLQDLTSSAFYGGNVTDEVTVTKAEYDPNAKTLTVAATSSVTGTTLTVGEYSQPLNGGGATIPNLDAPFDTIHVSSSAGGVGQAQVTTTLSSLSVPITPVLTAQNLNVTASAGKPVSISVPNTGEAVVNIVSQPTQSTTPLDVNAATNVITYTPSATATGTDSFTYSLSAGSVTSNTATVTITITAAPPAQPPPGTIETITVSAANYRGDQKRWQINGTDSVSNNQSLTIRNIGSVAAPKSVDLGPAVVTAGAWTLDIRGIANNLIPVSGDRVVAVNTNVTPPVSSAPLAATLTKLN